MKKIIQSGVYGKCVHPTCTTLAIIGWIIFFLFPDLRVFIGVFWFTAILFFWIKIEESFFMDKIARFQIEDSGPS